MSGRNARKADRAGGGSPGLHGAQRRKVGETGPGTRAYARAWPCGQGPKGPVTLPETSRPVGGCFN